MVTVDGYKNNQIDSPKKKKDKEMDNSNTTFTENKTEEEKPQIDPINQCMACGRRAGKYHTVQPEVFIGVYLINDVRGFKICNLCADEGKLMKKQKLGKSEKRKFKKFKREMVSAKNLPHITLDAKGNPVE